jgi:peptide/nickel transport system ATP-binding protein
MSKELLEVKDLHVGFKVFNGIAKVLDGMNINVWPSEKVGIVGETGCGKTTAMRAIMRTLASNSLITPESKIFFEGENILKMDNSEIQQIRRKKIAMVFEDPTSSLNPVFNIGTQLNDIVKYSHKENNLGEKELKEDFKQKVIQILKNVYLPDPERIYQSYPIQLSGGMRQRVCIAMALISKKKLLIFDEPGTSLDVTIKDQIFRLITKIISEEKTSIILISHNLGDIRHIAERVYVMYAGCIAEVAKTKEFFDNPLHPYSKGLLLATPRLSGGIGKGISGHIPNYLNPPKGCRFYPRCKYRMSICSEKKPYLFNINDSHQVACFLFQNKGVTINEN